MNQLLIIIRREFLSKIKSKSFYLFVLLSPLLFIIPVIANMVNENNYTINNKNYIGLKTNKNIIDTIKYRDLYFFKISPNIKENRLLAVVDLIKIENNKLDLLYESKDYITLSQKINTIESYINSNFIEKKYNFIEVVPKIKNSSEDLKIKTSTSIAFVLSMLIYISFILFNNSIIRSVLEEKTNKLSEVMSVFVKPKYLMSGKIIGQGLASFIQIFLWILVFLTYIKLLSIVEVKFFNIDNQYSRIGFLQDSLIEMKNMPIINICIFFPVFFILGLLFNGIISTILTIYSSNKSSNYLMFIGNILNMLSIYFGIYAATNPYSTITKISYYIPFVNYLTIPTTLPFNIDLRTILIGLLILIFSVIILFNLSGKIYKKSINY